MINTLSSQKNRFVSILKQNEWRSIIESRIITNNEHAVIPFSNNYLPNGCVHLSSASSTLSSCGDTKNWLNRLPNLDLDWKRLGGSKELPDLNLSQKKISFKSRSRMGDESFQSSEKSYNRFQCSINSEFEAVG